MSGFFGILRLDGKRVEEQFLVEIAEALRFRGPDGTSIWTKEGVGGCFARMETGPVRQAGTQPVCLGDRFLLWGDMRLDGLEELLRQLAETQCSLSADASSEEFFLQAWLKWGEGALEKVIGDFSLALWDIKERTLWCARDFIGARPLYYAYVQGVLCFSNTLDILRRVPEISDELDETFLADFFLAGRSMEPSRSVYRDIRRLPPGHLLKFSNGGIAIRRFRTLPIEEPLRLKHPQEYLISYRDLLKAAVADRLPKGATALYLSGGLDSSSLCAVAAEVAEDRGQKEKLKAFTVSWENFFDDQEPSLAKLTAEHLGVAHEVIQVQEAMPFEGADKLETTAPEPGEDFFFAREKRQSQRVASHANVLMVGYGGDDILTGQGWPYLVHLWRSGDWKAILRDFGGYLWSHGRIPPARAGFRGKLSRLTERENPLEGYPPWLNEEFEARVNIKRRWLEFKHRNERQEHPLHPRAYESLHSGYWGGVLEAEDAGWNRVRLETRAPLLDLRILRFQLRLPPVPWCVNKELVRQAMRGILPEAVVNRPKTPLLQDSLEECLKRGEWVPLLPKETPTRLERFVKWNEWCETFHGPKGSLNLIELRPLSLLFWLKAVEMRKWIQ